MNYKSVILYKVKQTLTLTMEHKRKGDERRKEH